MKSIIVFLVLFVRMYPTYYIENSELKDSGNVPFEYIKEKIIVPVQINGKTYKFLLDTGGIFEISEDLQNEFNFNGVNSTTIVDINRKEIELSTVLVPEINIGNWHFKNRKAIVSDLPNKYPYSCFKLDGMIGRDFFDNVLLHFDLASNVFRLTQDTEAIQLDKLNRTKLKLSKRGLPDIKISINCKTEYIEFDSGSGDFYSPKTADVERKLKKGTNTDILEFQGKFSFGVTMDDIKIANRYIEKVSSFKIANASFQDFYSDFSKVSAARIGAGILKYGKVSLDYKNGWFYYEPYSKNKNFEPLKTFGFDIAIQNGAYNVKYILKDSAADKSGLHPGNTILKIDATPTQNIQEDCEGYLNGYAFKDKEKINLTFINSQGIEKNIQLTNNVYK
ncbi:MAG: hypothetical protein CMC15_06615 [Flavobacteriaceae bacterium]|nr:hypothetical protein [Flavobacteriaceae bacterium]